LQQDAENANFVRGICVFSFGRIFGGWQFQWKLSHAFREMLLRAYLLSYTCVPMGLTRKSIQVRHAMFKHGVEAGGRDIVEDLDVQEQACRLVKILGGNSEKSARSLIPYSK